MSSPAHAQSVDEFLHEVKVDPRRGLTDAEVEERRQVHGFNELQEAPRTPWWLKLLAQFNELVIWILIVAAVISGFAQDWIDAAAIMAIVLLNGILGYLQEERAEQALQALQKMSAPLAKALRNGQLQSIPSRDLVPGDRIRLEAGDNIPADARLLEAYSFQVQEASLTGESVASEKRADVVLPEETGLGDRANSVFMSTVATAGKADAVVTATGMQTELGRIAGMLQAQKPDPTPLQRRLSELGKILVVVCLVIVAVIFFLELRRGERVLDVFLRSVSLAVAAVPEGLPAVVTLALAFGLQRMIKRNVLIRRAPSVETLGSVTVICSDKTGTLTRNEMTVRAVVAGGEWYQVTGTGYAPTGEFYRGQATASRDDSNEDLGQPVATDALSAELRQALLIGAVCNNSQLRRKEGDDGWEIMGDATEGALVVLARKAGLEFQDVEASQVFEIPFDSERKAMSVVFRAEDGSESLMTKGAPESVLALCQNEMRDGQIVPLTAERRRELQQINTELAHQALRVLGLGWRPGVERESGTADANGKYAERDLTFAGLVGMIDPPREEVKAAVAKCRLAGIQPVMITGDHPETAAAIARELRILDEGTETADSKKGTPHIASQILTGRELEKLTDDELTQRVADIAVYARVAPEHKLRVVQAWKRRGAVVAMTGDGVNDAPAVKAADIGVAMGITGTDVTKQASDMVLTDDNFSSIIAAVEEGRGIFDNIQKFIHYLLACNFGEVLFMLMATILGWPAPLQAIHLLWINLVTDGLPALALGIEPTEADVMQRPPRPPNEPVITWERGGLILFHGTLIAAAALIGFAMVYRAPVQARTDAAQVTTAPTSAHAAEEAVVNSAEEQHLRESRTVAFSIMAFSQLFFSVACRSHTRSLPALGVFTNPQLFYAILISFLLQLAVLLLPFMRPIFETPLNVTLNDWLLIGGLSLMPVTVIEVVKLIRAALQQRGRTP